MENNLILEGLLSMVTELKEKQEQQIMPVSREETMKRFDAIEQCLWNCGIIRLFPKTNCKPFQPSLLP